MLFLSLIHFLILSYCTITSATTVYAYDKKSKCFTVHSGFHHMVPVPKFENLLRTALPMEFGVRDRPKIYSWSVFFTFLTFFEFDSSWDVPVVCVRVCFQKIKKITKNPLLLFLSTSKAKQQETAHSIIAGDDVTNYHLPTQCT